MTETALRYVHSFYIRLRSRNRSSLVLEVRDETRRGEPLSRMEEGQG